jgi:hypothetical protein
MWINIHYYDGYGKLVQYTTYAANFADFQSKTVIMKIFRRDVQKILIANNKGNWDQVTWGEMLDMFKEREGGA